MLYGTLYTDVTVVVCVSVCVCVVMHCMASSSFGICQISEIPQKDEDEAYKLFLPALLPPKKDSLSSENSAVISKDTIEALAAKSYRAMTILKQDLNVYSTLIKGPTQAGLLVKDLLAGLALVVKDESQRFRTHHMRELLDVLVEKYPEKAMSAAGSGGMECVEEHLSPLWQSEQTLAVLTHLVCIGTTGRKGIASAEKSAQHTAMQQYYMQQQQNSSSNKVSLGQRRKFVKAMTDFSLIQALATALTSSSEGVGEELCESLLTIVEVVGYPPALTPIPSQVVQADKGKEEMVGEDVLLGPLGTAEWWKTLLSFIQTSGCTYEQREAICRVCHHVFALATGNSTRVSRSHAPATDATEQTSEKLVEEKEETVVNRLVEWGLTDKMHTALRSQIPLLIQVLQLPSENILSHQATHSTAVEGEEGHFIRHPGRYQTQPLGSWRLQLLSLLKEILIYRGDNNSDGKSLRILAMDALMDLPIPADITKSTKGKKAGEGGVTVDHIESDLTTPEIYNPWPALCSFVWAYPNNDFYHMTFFQMLQAVVVTHHEASLRLILQKSKFLSRAVNSLTDETLRGIMMNCLNLLKLRSESLPPSAFLHQYLGSHDGWKANTDLLSG